jgi:hypothetical protein
VATKEKRQTAKGPNRDAVRSWTNLSSSERQEMARQFLAEYPLTNQEREVFLESPRRVDKILGIEKHRDARIVARIVASEACIAGHGIGDTIAFDSMGRLLTAAGDRPVCIRLLNRVWYRLIMILDRMADDTEGAIGTGDFTGEVIDVRMNCYGAPFPYGDCGQVLMEFSVEGLG